jgi:hypothetical protein
MAQAVQPLPEEQAGPGLSLVRPGLSGQVPEGSSPSTSTPVMPPSTSGPGPATDRAARARQVLAEKRAAARAASSSGSINGSSEFRPGPGASGPGAGPGPSAAAAGAAQPLRGSDSVPPVPSRARYDDVSLVPVIEGLAEGVGMPLVEGERKACTWFDKLLSKYGGEKVLEIVCLVVLVSIIGSRVLVFYFKGKGGAGGVLGSDTGK